MKTSRLLLSLAGATVALGFTWLVAQEPPPDTPAPEPAPQAAAAESPPASDEPTPETSAPARSGSEAPLRRLDLPAAETVQGQAATTTDDTVERGDEAQASQTGESAENVSVVEDA